MSKNLFMPVACMVMGIVLARPAAPQ